MINIMINGKRKGLSVHKAVLNSFTEPPFENSQINHIDGNKQNNCLTNLEWCSPKENTKHSLYVLNNILLRGKPIMAIHESGWSRVFRSLRECAKFLKCSPGFVSSVIRGHKKKCKGCTFKWVDGGMEDT